MRAHCDPVTFQDRASGAIAGAEPPPAVFEHRPPQNRVSAPGGLMGGPLRECISAELDFAQEQGWGFAAPSAGSDWHVGCSICSGG
eukprot:8357636-Alexandrium_andersonii.AAC.1